MLSNNIVRVVVDALFSMELAPVPHQLDDSERPLAELMTEVDNKTYNAHPLLEKVTTLIAAMKFTASTRPTYENDNKPTDAQKNIAATLLRCIPEDKHTTYLPQRLKVVAQGHINNRGIVAAIIARFIISRAIQQSFKLSSAQLFYEVSSMEAELLEPNSSMRSWNNVFALVDRIIFLEEKRLEAEDNYERAMQTCSPWGYFKTGLTASDWKKRAERCWRLIDFVQSLLCLYLVLKYPVFAEKLRAWVPGTVHQFFRTDEEGIAILQETETPGLKIEEYGNSVFFSWIMLWQQLFAREVLAYCLLKRIQCHEALVVKSMNVEKTQCLKNVTKETNVFMSNSLSCFVNCIFSQNTYQRIQSSEPGSIVSMPILMQLFESAQNTMDNLNLKQLSLLRLAIKTIAYYESELQVAPKRIENSKKLEFLQAFFNGERKHNEFEVTCSICNLIADFEIILSSCDVCPNWVCAVCLKTYDSGGNPLLRLVLPDDNTPALAPAKFCSSCVKCYEDSKENRLLIKLCRENFSLLNKAPNNGEIEAWQHGLVPVVSAIHHANKQKTLEYLTALGVESSVTEKLLGKVETLKNRGEAEDRIQLFIKYCLELLIARANQRLPYLQQSDVTSFIELDYEDCIHKENFSWCMVCVEEFGLVRFNYRRKHHCRVCGQLVCGDCSQSRAVDAANKEQRVCDECMFLVDLTVRSPRFEDELMAPIE